MNDNNHLPLELQEIIILSLGTIDRFSCSLVAQKWAKYRPKELTIKDKCLSKYHPKYPRNIKEMIKYSDFNHELYRKHGFDIFDQDSLTKKRQCVYYYCKYRSLGEIELIPYEYRNREGFAKNKSNKVFKLNYSGGHIYFEHPLNRKVRGLENALFLLNRGTLYFDVLLENGKFTLEEYKTIYNAFTSSTNLTNSIKTPKLFSFIDYNKIVKVQPLETVLWLDNHYPIKDSIYIGRFDERKWKDFKCLKYLYKREICLPNDLIEQCFFQGRTALRWLRDKKPNLFYSSQLTLMLPKIWNQYHNISTTNKDNNKLINRDNINKKNFYWALGQLKPHIKKSWAQNLLLVLIQDQDLTPLDYVYNYLSNTIDRSINLELDEYITRNVFMHQCFRGQNQVEWLCSKISFTLKHFVTCIQYHSNSLPYLKKWVVIKEDHVNEIKKFNYKSRRIIWNQLLDFKFNLPKYGNSLDNDLLRSLLDTTFEAIVFTKELEAYLYFGLEIPKNALKIALSSKRVDENTVRLLCQNDAFFYIGLYNMAPNNRIKRVLLEELNKRQKKGYCLKIKWGQ